MNSDARARKWLLENEIVSETVGAMFAGIVESLVQLLDHEHNAAIDECHAVCEDPFSETAWNIRNLKRRR